MQIQLSGTQSSAFILSLFNYRTAIHMQHLCSTTYAQHVALNELYDTLTDLADKYAETYMGKFGQYALPKTLTSFVIAADPLTTLEMLQESISNERTSVASSTALQNILDELSGAVSQTAYKLKYLQ